MDICRNTQSADHFRKKTSATNIVSHKTIDVVNASTVTVARELTIKPRSSKSPNYQYEPLVGDPCYRYNKHAKERFFKNVYLAYLFV